MVIVVIEWGGCGGLKAKGAVAGQEQNVRAGSVIREEDFF
jgi:hypothetical protein